MSFTGFKSIFTAGALLVATTASMPAAAFELKGPPKVAFIYASAVQDGGWNEALDVGRKAVEEQLGLPVAVAENIPEEATKLRAAIDLYVKRGFNIIVGTTYGYSAPLEEAAKAYPNVAFLNASGITNGPNLESFYARTYQGWYLAGIAAAGATETKKIGMLAGFPVGVVNWDINSFIQGARSVDPEIYRNRNLIERFFGKLKNARGIATRYDKRAANFMATIKLFSTRIWIKSYESTA